MAKVILSAYQKDSHHVKTADGKLVRFPRGQELPKLGEIEVRQCADGVLRPVEQKSAK